jgi:hypothetical protein
MPAVNVLRLIRVFKMVSSILVYERETERERERGGVVGSLCVYKPRINVI